MVVVKSAEKPPFQVPVELNVLLSYHFTERHFNLLAPEIEASDVVCPESSGLFREHLPNMYALFRGTEEEKRRNIRLQYLHRKPDAAYTAALINRLFNHPHIVLLDVAPTRERAEEIDRLHVGSSGPAISSFMQGNFEEALEFGFDTVESRARAFDLRHRQFVGNAVRELPPVVNGIRPAHGKRVRCSILFGSEHHELPVALAEALSSAGDVTLSGRRMEGGASVGFDRLVHEVLGSGMAPLPRDVERNREQLARGLLDVLILNFYPANSWVRLDGAYGSGVITQISDGFTLNQIEGICREAGDRLGYLPDRSPPYPSLVWVKTMKEHGVVFPEPDLRNR